VKLFFPLLFLVIINEGLIAQVNDSNRYVKRLYLINKSRIDELNGKPISFYLSHKGIDKNSKKFYRGEIGVSNDSITKSIVDSLLTNNLETRPFYFFLFNQIVDLSNGQMVDIVAPKCTEFVREYPCDFFNSFNQNEININVVKWTTYIGLTLKDKTTYFDFRNKIDSIIRINCSGVQDLSKSFFTEVRMCLVR
jgi:hypothetical protein